jgi:hypothetical protein
MGLVIRDHSPDPLTVYLPDDQRAFKAALNVVVAEEWALDGRRT